MANQNQSHSSPPSPSWTTPLMHPWQGEGNRSRRHRWQIFRVHAQKAERPPWGAAPAAQFQSNKLVSPPPLQLQKVKPTPPDGEAQVLWIIVTRQTHTNNNAEEEEVYILKAIVEDAVEGTGWSGCRNSPGWVHGHCENIPGHGWHVAAWGGT